MFLISLYISEPLSLASRLSHLSNFSDFFSSTFFPASLFASLRFSSPLLSSSLSLSHSLIHASSIRPTKKYVNLAKVHGNISSQTIVSIFFNDYLCQKCFTTTILAHCDYFSCFTISPLLLSFALCLYVCVRF